MKNPLLLGTTLLLGIFLGLAVGWIGGGGSRDGAEAGEQSTRQPSGRAGARPGSGAGEVLADYLKGKSPAELTAEEAYQLIAPQLEGFPIDWTGDPVERARQNYQFELLASKLPLDLVERLMDMGRENRGNNYMLQQWFGAYVARDFDRAMAWADRQPDSRDWRGTAIQRLAGTDPDRAMKLHLKEIQAGSTSWNTTGLPNRVAREYGKRGSAALLAMTDSMPGEDTQSMIYGGWEALPEEEKPAFLAELGRRAEAGRPEWKHYQNVLTLSRAEEHPEELRVMMEKMPPQAQADTALKLAARQIQRGKTDAAKEYIRTAMTAIHGSQKDLVNGIFGNMHFSNSPDMLPMMVEMLPQDQKPTQADVRNWFPPTSTRPHTALNMARFITSPEERAQYVADAFNNLPNSDYRKKANATDFDILSKRLQSMGLTGEAADRAKASLQAARKKALEK